MINHVRFSSSSLLILEAPMHSEAPRITSVHHVLLQFRLIRSQVKDAILNGVISVNQFSRDPTKLDVGLKIVICYFIREMSQRSAYPKQHLIYGSKYQFVRQRSDLSINKVPDFACLHSNMVILFALNIVHSIQSWVDSEFLSLSLLEHLHLLNTSSTTTEGTGYLPSVLNQCHPSVVS